MGTTPASGGVRFGGKVSETTNVIPFPATWRARRLLADGAPCSGPGDYEFTEKELDALCRWFSAMKYAFPGTEGVMIVSHQQNYSAVGLYNPAGGAPNCLIAKHTAGGTTRFFWSTESDPPRARGGQPVDMSQIQPGDVVNYYSDASHSAIYIGDGMMVHASTYGTPVRVAPVNNAPIYNIRRY